MKSLVASPGKDFLTDMMQADDFRAIPVFEMTTNRIEDIVFQHLYRIGPRED